MLVLGVLGACSDGGTGAPAEMHITARAPMAEPVAHAVPSGDAVFVAPVVFPRPAGERTIVASVGGVERRWTLVVPPNTTDDQHLPMVVALHGVGGQGANMRALGFDPHAAAEGVVMAYPDAHAGSWNDGRPGLDPVSDVVPDDVAFLREVVHRAVTEVGVDPTRVGLVGHSNGALMTGRAACDMAGELAAAVLVAGAGPRDVARRCHPSRPVALMIVFGAADTVVPYDGGQVAPYRGRSRGQVAGVAEVLELWRGVNGCAGHTDDQVAVTPRVVVRDRGTRCRADVVHYRVQGAGHEWLAAPTFDTTGEAWQFLATHLGT